ncbi:MAG: alkaline shock response membrane anchor protein AmaP [Candidatus Tritonobacter lacicola]|nr:alkaline shock response membrane anchor protein AmaP [Candidatus Tritonobacter lacicola]
MRLIRALIVAMYTMLALLGGLIILVLAVGWPLFGLEEKVGAAAVKFIAPLIPADEIARGVTGYPEFPLAGNPSTILGAVLVLLALIFIWAQVRCSRKAKCIAFENPGGEVDIAVSAVEDFIRRTGKDFPEVKGIEPIIRGGRRGISVAVKVVLWSGCSIPNLTERMQEKIKEDVQSFLGIDVSSVAIIVTKVVPAGSGADQLLEE